LPAVGRAHAGGNRPGQRTARARHSDRTDALGLRTLGPLNHVELDSLVLAQLAETVRVDGGAVDENVRAASVLGDETESLVRVEPLPPESGAVYAPGLSPMDFHLVVETAIYGLVRHPLGAATRPA
jgi:hypothetical protein